MAQRGYVQAMTASRIALVTGANQGLGRALVERLALRMAPQDRVLLTGRDPDRVHAAAAAVAGGPATARVEGRVLDVRDGDAIAALAAELGEVDVVFSNAAARMSPEADPAGEVDAVAETNNLATCRMLRAFAPRLRPGGRLIVVASALGTLDKLGERVAGRFAAAADGPRRRRLARGRLAREPSTTPVPCLRATATGSTSRPRSLRSLPSAPSPASGATPTSPRTSWSHGAVPRARRHRRLAPVVRDMSRAQSPAEAARWPVELALAGAFDPAFYGELVQFGRVIPWESGVPVPHNAVA